MKKLMMFVLTITLMMSCTAASGFDLTKSEKMQKVVNDAFLVMYACDHGTKQKNISKMLKSKQITEQFFKEAISRLENGICPVNKKNFTASSITFNNNTSIKVGDTIYTIKWSGKSVDSISD